LAVTLDSAVPPSCIQPASVDYSGRSRPAFQPYAVRFSAWSYLRLPIDDRDRTAGLDLWKRSSSALIGTGPDPGHGLGVGIDSVEIDEFRCRWTDKGVTLVEPDGGIEHFIPAERFLGGR